MPSRANVTPMPGALRAFRKYGIDGSNVLYDSLSLEGYEYFDEESGTAVFCEWLDKEMRTAVFQAAWADMRAVL